MAPSAAAARSRHKTGSRGGCGKGSTSRRYAAKFPNSARHRAITSRSRRRRSVSAPLQTGSMPEGRSGRPRSATIATVKGQRSPERCARASWVAYHQQCAAVRRFDQTIAEKSGLLISTDGRVIGWIGIGDDAQCATLEPVIDEATNESWAVAASDHARLANEQIDAARARGL